MRSIRRLTFACVACILCVAMLPGPTAANYQPVTGQPHDDFMLPEIRTGQPIRLSDFRGKKTLLILFASWSPKCRKEIPLWCQSVENYVVSGRLQVLGVTQEQHAERCRLFAQWHQLNWPILHDPLNLLRVRTVPLLLMIDENGIVRGPARNMDSLRKFMEADYSKPESPETPGEVKSEITPKAAYDAGMMPSGDPPLAQDAPPATTQPLQPQPPVAARPEATDSATARDSAHAHDANGRDGETARVGPAIVAALPPQTRDRPRPDPSERWEIANAEPSVIHWMDAGDAYVLWGDANTIDRAIAAYLNAMALEPETPRLNFCLGVAYRMRHESPGATQHDDDFLQSVTYWEKAIRQLPTQTIWRRRLQQYGPILDKPFRFYDWIPLAEEAIRERGEQPVSLEIALSDTERATGRDLPHIVVTADQPPIDRSTSEHVDPHGVLPPDVGQLVRIVPVTVPHTDPEKHELRVHLQLIPQPSVHWSEEKPVVTLLLECPEGWECPARVDAERLAAAAINGTRIVEFELTAKAQEEMAVDATEPKDVDAVSKQGVPAEETSGKSPSPPPEPTETAEALRLRGVVFYHVGLNRHDADTHLRQAFSIELPFWRSSAADP